MDIQLSTFLKQLDSKARDAIQHLLSKKVCIGFKTSYIDGKPTNTVFMPVTITKKDQFYRAGGKVISRNMALECLRLNIAVFKEV